MSNQLAAAARQYLIATAHLGACPGTRDVLERAIAAHEAAKPEPEPLAWLVCSVNKDGSLSLEHAAPWRESAHEHINDAINSFGIREAARWVVRPAYATPVAVASPWMPIETAPKDGRRVLIHMPRSDRKVLEAYWATPYEGAPDDQCWWSTPHGVAGRGYTILQKAVTHWMPLPPAPKEQQHE